MSLSAPTRASSLARRVLMLATWAASEVLGLAAGLMPTELATREALSRAAILRRARQPTRGLSRSRPACTTTMGWTAGTKNSGGYIHLFAGAPRLDPLPGGRRGSAPHLYHRRRQPHLGQRRKTGHRNHY